jgi:glutathione peroxidase
MLRVLPLLLIWVVLARPALADACPASLDFRMRPLASDRVESLCERHAGKVLLVVNTASRCGFTSTVRRLGSLVPSLSGSGICRTRVSVE